MIGNPNIFNLVGHGFANTYWLIICVTVALFAIFNWCMWTISTRRPGWDATNEAILGRYLTIFSMTGVFTSALFIALVSFLAGGWTLFGYVK